MPKLVLATNNDGKLREFERLLDGCGFELVTPRQLDIAFELKESGATFAENATIKATEAVRATGLIALADDSGLEVDYLGGRPGIFSARYAGADRTDPALSEAQRYRIVLEEMAGVPDARRSARFRAAIAIATPAGALHLVDGVFEGRIAHEARGKNGFGYDPIFFVPELGVTSAELPDQRKDELSHRGQAARKAREILRRIADAGSTP